MKKAIACFVCIIMVLSLSVTSFADSVIGLQEKMDALFLKNNFTQEEITAMNQQYVDYQTNAFWESQLPYIEVSGKWHTDNKNPDEELEWYLNYVRADYISTVLATVLNTKKYTAQFATLGNFEYLFSEQQYWAMPYSEMATVAKFTKDGTFFEQFDDRNTPLVKLPQEARDFLSNTSRIENSLLKLGETSISDVKIFALSDMLTFLYLKCEGGEYLAKLYGNASGPTILPRIDLFDLYPIGEVMDAILSTQESDFIYKQNVAARVSATKPIYETEGEALMTEGIIQGNEKGFDPLKPLSRIEAITILVRALGLENETTSETSQFEDIPNNHWGKKYANIAKTKGLTNGVGNNKFAPDDKVNANQFAAMLLRDSEGDSIDWEQALNILVEKGIISDESSEKMDFFTRGDMAKIIYEARGKGLLKK